MPSMTAFADALPKPGLALGRYPERAAERPGWGDALVGRVAARWGWFPMGGFTSDDFGDLSLWGKAVDLVHRLRQPALGLLQHFYEGLEAGRHHPGQSAWCRCI